MEAISAARPHGLRFPKPRRVLAALSDERLVERVRSGDAAAFEVLYDRHHRGALAFCRHMLQSADEAEDAVQHAFIAAYNELHRDGDRDIRFKPWLYTIARNRCLSVLRARREQAAEDIEISTDRLSDEVQQRADLQALLADISELPREQREALVLSEVGDLSHADVAAVIGCEVDKVKSLVFQARSALIERRQGREMPCSEIREQLATLRGGALRRSHLRHHLAACPGCRQYRDDLRRQREMLALALPVVPSVVLKHQVLAAVGLGGGGAAGGGLAAGLGLGAKTGLAKLGIAALVAAGGAGTAVVATHGHLPLVGGGSDKTPAATAAADTGAAGAGRSGTSTHTTSVSAKSRSGRSASGTQHGFTPVQGGSNGAAANEFAKTRGEGKHKGLYKSRHHSHRQTPVRHRHVTTRVHPVTPAPRAAPKTQSAPTRSTETTPTTTSTTTTTTPTTTTPTETTPAPTGGGKGGHGKGGSVGNAVP